MRKGGSIDRANLYPDDTAFVLVDPDHATGTGLFLANRCAATVAEP